AVAHAKGQRRRPAPKIAVERVVLFFQCAVTRLETMRQARRPVLVETKVKGAQEGVVPRVRPQRRIAPQVTMATRPTPGAVRGERQRVVRLAPLSVVQIVTRLGVYGKPGARLEIEVRINVGEGPLAWPRIESPIRVNGPVQEVFLAGLSFGLQFVSQA